MFREQKQSDESWLSVTISVVMVLSLFLLLGFTPETENKTKGAFITNINESERVVFQEKNTIFASSTPTYEEPQTVAVTRERQTEKRWVEVTGYSSTVDQTNSDPFTTASGETVRDGIVAANFLSFGTEIRIPEMFGDKVFVVKDRMNRRYSPPYDNVWHDGYVDIWFHTREEARLQGREITHIEILK